MVEPEPMMEKIPVVEEPIAVSGVTDPNKKMDPDEIAALFASMGGNVDKPDPVVEPEPMVESQPIEEPEPAKQIDMSDPNKKMNPDEIAALIASMGASDNEPKEEPVVIMEPEPVLEEKPPMPDMSDPNIKMTPDEIAALIANM